MDAAGVALIVVSGSAGVSILAGLFLQQRKIRFDHRLRLRELEYRTEKDFHNRQADMTADNLAQALPRLLRELPDAIAAGLSREFARVVADVAPKTSTDSSGLVGITHPVDSYDSLTREISHSLNTPLAQIEAAALTLKGLRSGDISAQLSRILEGVSVCKSFLYAFRGLSQVAATSSGWFPASLLQAVKSAATVYIDREGAAVEVVADLPDEIEGYNNNYVLALVLPLLENAVEAGPVGRITIQYVITQTHNVMARAFSLCETGSASTCGAASQPASSRRDLT